MAFLRRGESKPLPVWVTRVIMYFLFVVFTVGFIELAHDLREEYQLYRHGMFSPGTVVRIKPVRGGYDADYKFNYNGITYQSTSDANQNWMYATALPAATRVQFLASNPSISRAPEVRSYTLLWSKIFFCCFFCVASFVMVVAIFSDWNGIIEQRRARRKGGQPWQLPTYPKAWH